ncbi:hypothetical protein ACI0X9_003315 [Cronobacter turicensis]
MDNFTRNSVFIIPTENFELPSDQLAFFEEALQSRGFRTEKDAKGCYISEMTQVAFFTFSLGIYHAKDANHQTRKHELETPAPSPTSLTPAPAPAAAPASDFPNCHSETPPDLSRSSINETDTPKTSSGEFAELINEDGDKNNVQTIIMGRFFHKHLYLSKAEALRRANVISREYVIPMWVHQSSNEEGWHISSHGFGISRRPDALVKMSELDRKQIENGFAPSSMADMLEPSVVTRIADTGRTYIQNGLYFAGNVLLEWMRDQADPAIVLSIDQRSREKRAARIAELQDSIKQVLGYTSFYRWITEDTLVVALSKDQYDYSFARERVQNPFWVIKALTWPNTIILKEKN